MTRVVAIRQKRTLYPELYYAFDGIGFIQESNKQTGYYCVTIDANTNCPVGGLTDYLNLVDGSTIKVYPTEQSCLPKQKQIEVMARCTALLRVNDSEIFRILNKDKTQLIEVVYWSGRGAGHSRQKVFTLSAGLTNSSKPSVKCNMNPREYHATMSIRYEEFMEKYMEKKDEQQSNCC